jgi:hypothetical protein
MKVNTLPTIIPFSSNIKSNSSSTLGNNTLDNNLIMIDLGNSSKNENKSVSSTSLSSFTPPSFNTFLPPPSNKVVTQNTSSSFSTVSSTKPDLSFFSTSSTDSPIPSVFSSSVQRSNYYISNVVDNDNNNDDDEYEYEYEVEEEEENENANLKKSLLRK